MDKETVMVKIQIPENCGICRFNTDIYFSGNANICTLIGEAIRNKKTINKGCLLMAIKRGEVVYAANKE